MSKFLTNQAIHVSLILFGRPIEASEDTRPHRSGALLSREAGRMPRFPASDFSYARASTRISLDNGPHQTPCFWTLDHARLPGRLSAAVMGIG